MFNTRAYEFHDFIFYKAIFKYSFFNSESHVLWAYAMFRFTSAPVFIKIRDNR